MATEKVQVVFMADTAIPHNLADSLKLHHRSVCLAAVRILLYLSRFPIREHLNKVLWNFKLFNSERLEKTTKTWQFHENRSELIEKFFQKLHDSLAAPIESTKGGSIGSPKPVKLVYNALAAVIQDFVWDAPEIMSPIRPRKRGRVIGTNTTALNLPSSKEDSCDKNIVFIFSRCPASDGELRRFCYGSEVNQDPVSMATIREQLLPVALLNQLSTKRITVHWIHTGAVSDQGGWDKVRMDNHAQFFIQRVGTWDSSLPTPSSSFSLQALLTFAINFCFFSTPRASCPLLCHPKIVILCATLVGKGVLYKEVFAISRVVLYKTLPICTCVATKFLF